MWKWCQIKHTLDKKSKSVLNSSLSLFDAVMAVFPQLLCYMWCVFPRSTIRFYWNNKAVLPTLTFSIWNLKGILQGIFKICLQRKWNKEVKDSLKIKLKIQKGKTALMHEDEMLYTLSYVNLINVCTIHKPHPSHKHLTVDLQPLIAQVCSHLNPHSVTE